MDAQKELITVKEVSQRLKVPVGTIQDWARRGIIPEVKMTRRTRRFVYEDVLAAIATHGSKLKTTRK